MILDVVIGIFIYDMLTITFINVYRLYKNRQNIKLKNQYKAELETKGITILETQEDIEQYMKVLNKEHLKAVKNDDDSDDPRNNN